MQGLSAQQYRDKQGRVRRDTSAANPPTLQPQLLHTLAQLLLLVKVNGIYPWELHHAGFCGKRNPRTGEKLIPSPHSYARTAFFLSSTPSVQ